MINTRITKGIIKSRNKLRLLCHTKRSTDLSKRSLKYIQNYHKIYRKVIAEAKIREADKIILSTTNKNKTFRKIINKETGNSQQAPNITLNSQDKIITNPQMIAEKFNSYFIDIIEDLLSQTSKHCPQQNLKTQIKECLETMFIAPVTAAEVIRVIKDLKNTSSVGFDKTPTFLVKQCLCYLIKPLVHICNISFQTGTFPDVLKRQE